MTDKVTVKRVWMVKLKPDYTLILNGLGGSDIEIRPVYEPGLGPAIRLYRSTIGDDWEYLTTITAPVASAMISRLPLVLSAARRLAKARLEPNNKPGSSPP